MVVCDEDVADIPGSNVHEGELSSYAVSGIDEVVDSVDNDEIG
jgi:hypothetical protein